MKLAANFSLNSEKLQVHLTLEKLAGPVKTMAE